MVYLQHTLFLITLISQAQSIYEDLLEKDPSLWPGHLEPFGSKQKIIEVDRINYWPDPTSTFLFV